VKINDATGQILALHQEWRDIIHDCAGCRVEKHVRWPAYAIETARLAPTWPSHAKAVEQRQYSFRLIDEAILQLCYEYDADGISSASLGYMEGTWTHLIREMPLAIAIQTLLEAERGAAPGPDADPFYLRIDYSPTAMRSVEHPACHLHLSALPGARIPVNRLPTPFQFFEFCVRTTLPTIYHERRLASGPPYGFQGRVNALATDVLSDMGGLVGLGVPGEHVAPAAHAVPKAGVGSRRPAPRRGEKRGR
jgi:hypothetical protein